MMNEIVAHNDLKIRVEDNFFNSNEASFLYFLFFHHDELPISKVIIFFIKKQ